MRTYFNNFLFISHPPIWNFYRNYDVNKDSKELVVHATWWELLKV